MLEFLGKFPCQTLQYGIGLITLKVSLLHIHYMTFKVVFVILPSKAHTSIIQTDQDPNLVDRDLTYDPRKYHLIAFLYPAKKYWIRFGSSNSIDMNIPRDNLL